MTGTDRDPNAPMREAFAAHAQVAARLAERPPWYAAALRDAVLREDHRGVHFDPDRLNLAVAAGAFPPPASTPGAWDQIHRWAATAPDPHRAAKIKAGADGVAAGLSPQRRQQFDQLRFLEPPPADGRVELCRWTLRQQNLVRHRLGQLPVGYAAAAERYGWPPEWPADHLQVRNAATGLGDAVCGLYAVCGLADATGRPVVYHSHSAGWLARASHPGVTIVPVERRAWPTAAPDMLDGADGYDRQTRTAKSRVGDYAANLARMVGVPPFAPAAPAAVDRSVRSGDNPAGPYVVLSPFSAHGVREWPAANWAELARRLHAAGLRVVAAGNAEHADRLAAAFGPTPALWIHGRDPDGVADLLLGAEAVVGNDSGIAHYAGLLGVTTVAVHAGALSHGFLFGHAPAVTSVTTGRPLSRSDNNPGELARVHVDRVLAEVCRRLAEAPPPAYVMPDLAGVAA